MRTLVLFITFGLAVAGCSDTTSTTSEQDPTVLILGTWTVTEATIDSQSYPVSTPGFGQVQATFDTDFFTYIYPQLHPETGFPTGETDTVTAVWAFNDDHSLLTISNPIDNTVIFEWNILRLQVGVLSTTYKAQSAMNANVISDYAISYKLN